MVAAFEWQQALAWLGYAEDQNCIAHNGARSCVLPVKGDGVHSMPEAARKAGDLFLAFARKYAGKARLEVQARWLLERRAPGVGRLARRAFPPICVSRTTRSRPRSTSRSGRIALPSSVWRCATTPAASAMDDFDGDGLLDIVISSSDPCDGYEEPSATTAAAASSRWFW